MSAAATRLQHRIAIARAPQQIFDYATTPGRWPEWHPSSLRLAPGAETPLPAGARFEEDIRAGGREGHLSWIVREARRPERWTAEARMSNGGSLRLTYEVRPAGDGAVFERTLEYAMPNRLWRLLDALLLRRRIDRESAESLRQLKQRLESAPAA